MAERFHLDSVSTASGTIWFTLVIDNPLTYYVELYNDSRNAFIKDRTKRILPADLSKHWVNGVPLISLVENKLEEMAELAHLKSLKDYKTPPRNFT